MKSLKLLIALVLLGMGAHATVFTVTNTGDSGTGSLREALTYANAMPGPNSIIFNIPASDPNFDSGKGIWTVTPQSTLPFITQSGITIDGTTQTTFGGNTNANGPEICIDGKHLYGSDFAFHLYNASNNVIKGLIIGGFTVGIEISGSGSANNTIVGNYIGCNHNATDTLSNTHGIELLSGPHDNIIGGETVAERNIFSGNTHCGIRIVNSNNNIVKGNYVGLNRTGNSAVKNYDGVSIEGTSCNNLIGGYNSASRNYVSGNDAYGIPIFGAGCTQNRVVGNYIGTDVTGNTAIPNTYGVLCDDGAHGNMVGGYASGAQNLISGNSGYGIFLYNPQTQFDSIIGNVIGLNFNCTAKLPNANGIVIDGPTYRHFIDSNVISGNLQNGIDLHIGGTDSNIIVRNFIGTDFSGASNFGNTFDGVRIAEGPKYNQIGQEGKGNTIAFNGGSGISVMTDSSLYNRFTENRIFSNGSIGIDLYPLGSTANDAGDCDLGPNNLMNAPVIVSSDYSSGTTTIHGTIDHTCDGGNQGIAIELFASNIATGSQAQRFVGRTTTNSAGEWSFITTGLLPTEFVTATATDISGNTSELSNNQVVGIGDLQSSENQGIIIFPNPCNGTFTVQLGSEDSGDIEIIDLCGKIVFKQAVSTANQRVNATSLDNGCYFVRFTSEIGRQKGMMKIVVAK